MKSVAVISAPLVETFAVFSPALSSILLIEFSLLMDLSPLFDDDLLLVLELTSLSLLFI